MLDLTARLDALAAAPSLLVALDFDGTLAPIAPTPPEARPDPAALAALLDLASRPNTHAAIISGRARADLLDLLRAVPLPESLALIGSHGAETGPDFRPAPDALALLDQAATLAHALAAQFPGALVERKPAGVALHVRPLAGPQADHAAAALALAANALPGLTVLLGHRVVELCVVVPGKGVALAALRDRLAAAASSGAPPVTLYAGDDTTDESAFLFLAPHDADVPIKIGPGPSAARFRLDSQAQLAPLLADLARRRRDRVAAAAVTPITHHALLSDQRTAALVDPRGSIVWACFPRLDSPSLFSALLAGPGHFSITPDPRPDDPPRQRYEPDAFLLHTQWPTLTVTDCLDASAGRAFQRAGRSDLLRVISGSGRARVTFAPRLDFGRVQTTLLPREHGLEIEGWTDPIVLLAPGVRWTITRESRDDTAHADLDLAHGPWTLELRYGTASFRPAPEPADARLAANARFWAGWTRSLSLHPAHAAHPPHTPTLPHAALLTRSALVLRALAHGPSGAIAAAATTSLPESLAGVRNWDYRFCWPRDAALAAASLIRLGNTGLALRFLDWLASIIERGQAPERLRPLYTLSGDELGPEAELPSLPGYAGSAPVRIGNAASHQVQLDVFGPIVDLVALLAESGAPITPLHWRLVEDMVHAVAARWTEPDHGIWELRGPRKHHVHTKAMCWWAAHRGLVVADLAMGLPRPHWAALRDAIRDDVLAHGFHPDANAFTTAYGQPHLDVASLWVLLSGLLPPDDPRAIATVDAVNAHLRRGPVVDRYRMDDGLPGREGGWIIGSTWLVEALALIGRRDEAAELLDQVAALAGPLGLFAEQHEPDVGMPLGNYPQAYSHLGLINAAVRLAALR